MICRKWLRLLQQSWRPAEEACSTKHWYPLWNNFSQINSWLNFHMIGVKLQQRTKPMPHHQALQSGHRADGVLFLSAELLRETGPELGPRLWASVVRSPPSGLSYSCQGIDTTPPCALLTLGTTNHHSLTRVEVQTFFLSDKVNDQQTWFCQDRWK